MKTITITTSPVSTNKRYTIARGRNILTNEYRDAKEAIAWEVKSQWKKEPLTDDVCLNVLIYHKGRTPDIDNYLKLILDSLTGVVYEDDKQVNELHIFREKAETAKLIVQVV
jgi:crossover junction endodeoxyribonuclease RusA